MRKKQIEDSRLLGYKNNLPQDPWQQISQQQDDAAVNSDENRIISQATCLYKYVVKKPLD